MHMDAEVLLHLVQQHPELWDTVNCDYKDEQKKGKAWSEVAKQLFEDYESWAESQQKIQIKKVMVKWRTLRDNYVCSIKKQEGCSRSGSGAKKIHTYIYADLLSFLKKTIEPRPTVSNIDPRQSSSKESIEPTPSGSKETGPTITTTMNIDPQISDDDLEIIPAEGDKPTLVHASAERKKNRRKRGTANVEEAVIKFMDSHQPQKSMVEEDDDVAFLYSLIPVIKKLSSPQNASFRIQTIQTLDRMIHPPPNPPMAHNTGTQSQTSTSSGSG